MHIPVGCILDGRQHIHLQQWQLDCYLYVHTFCRRQRCPQVPGPKTICSELKTYPKLCSNPAYPRRIADGDGAEQSITLTSLPVIQSTRALHLFYIWLVKQDNQPRPALNLLAWSSKSTPSRSPHTHIWHGAACIVSTSEARLAYLVSAFAQTQQTVLSLLLKTFLWIFALSADDCSFCIGLSPWFGLAHGTTSAPDWMWR